jgi:hypothetical protein
MPPRPQPPPPTPARASTAHVLASAVSLLYLYDLGRFERVAECLFRARGFADAGASWQLVLAFVREKRLHVASPQPEAAAHAVNVSAEPAPEERGDPVSPAAGSEACGLEASWFHGREVHQVEFVPGIAAAASAPASAAGDAGDAGGGSGGRGQTAGEQRLVTASEDGTLKILAVRPCRLLTSVRDGRAAIVGRDSEGGGGVEVVSRETIQGDKKEQLGAALRCLARVQTRGHGLIMIAGGGAATFAHAAAPRPPGLACLALPAWPCLACLTPMLGLCLLATIFQSMRTHVGTPTSPCSQGRAPRHADTLSRHGRRSLAQGGLGSRV